MYRLLNLLAQRAMSNVCDGTDSLESEKGFLSSTKSSRWMFGLVDQTPYKQEFEPSIWGVSLDGADMTKSRERVKLEDNEAEIRKILKDYFSMQEITANWMHTLSRWKRENRTIKFQRDKQNFCALILICISRLFFLFLFN